MAIVGTIENGAGKGAYYLSQKEYMKQFEAKFGFNPFPGTLNLEVNKEKLVQFLSNKIPLRISGFKTKGRRFGAITAYRVLATKIISKMSKIKMSKIKARDGIGAIESAIVIPERASHPDNIIEIVAPLSLRDSLKLKDGDKVKLTSR